MISKILIYQKKNQEKQYIDISCFSKLNKYKLEQNKYIMDNNGKYNGISIFDGQNLHLFINDDDCILFYIFFTDIKTIETDLMNGKELFEFIDEKGNLIRVIKTIYSGNDSVIYKKI